MYRRWLGRGENFQTFSWFRWHSSCTFWTGTNSLGKRQAITTVACLMAPSLKQALTKEEVRKKTLPVVLEGVFHHFSTCSSPLHILLPLLLLIRMINFVYVLSSHYTPGRRIA